MRIRHRALGRVGAWGFVASTTAYSALGVAGKVLGEGVNAVGPLLLLASMVCCGLVFVGYRSSQRLPVPPHYAAFVGAVSLAAMVGVAVANPPRIVAFDMMTYGTVAAFLWAGRSDELWADLRWPVIIFTAIALLLAALYTDPHTAIERSLLRLQPTYSLQSAFWLSLIILLRSSGQWETKYFVALFSVTTTQLALLLTFSKRAPSTRVALFALVALFLRGRKSSVRQMAVIASTALVAALAVRSALPWMAGLGTTWNRVEDTEFFSADQNIRWLEARDLVSELTPFEVVFGKGLGGYFVDSPLGIWDQLGGSTFGRTSMHVGLFVPLMKGGLVLAVAYNLLLIATVFRRVDARTERYMLPLRLGALIILAFSLIEGPADFSSLQLAAAIGLVGSAGSGRGVEQSGRGATG